MRDAAGQPAERFHLVRLLHILVIAAPLVFHLDAVADVARDAEDGGAVGAVRADAAQAILEPPVAAVAMLDAVLKRGRRRAAERFARFLLDVFEIAGMDDRVAQPDHLLRRIAEKIGDASADEVECRALFHRMQREDDLVDVLQNHRRKVPGGLRHCGEFYLLKMPFSPRPMAPKIPCTARWTRCFMLP